MSHRAIRESETDLKQSGTGGTFYPMSHRSGKDNPIASQNLMQIDGSLVPFTGEEQFRESSPCMGQRYFSTVEGETRDGRHDLRLNRIIFQQTPQVGENRFNRSIKVE